MTRCVLRFCVLAGLLLAPFTGPAAASLPLPSKLAVTSVQRSGDAYTYRIRVDAAGRAVIVLVPYDARLATLVINGIEHEPVGHDVPVGTRPLGHGEASFFLEGLRLHDVVTIRVEGSKLPLRFLYNADIVAESHDIGFWSGVYYAILVTVALFQIVTIVVLRDATVGWYLGFTLTIIGDELARDAAFPFDRAINLALLVAFSLLSLVCVVGFSSSYLRLRIDAPRLFALALVASILPILLAAGFVALTHHPLDIGFIVLPYLVSLLAWTAIAIVRRRGGYTPATYLGLGLFGLTVVFAARIVREVAGFPSPFLDRWSFEMGSIFDVCAFSLGVTVRSQYLLRERRRLEAALGVATFAAAHDELTGVLNRRGLEACSAQLDAVESTVLFADLDDFKRVNDRGGHAAGDDVLRIVARVIEHAVRDSDVVARVGGDEFVIVLVDSLDAAHALDVIARIESAVALLRPLGPADPTRIGISIGRAVTLRGRVFATAVAGADADAYRVKAEHYARAREARRQDVGSSISPSVSSLGR